MHDLATAPEVAAGPSGGRIATVAPEAVDLELRLTMELPSRAESPHTPRQALAQLESSVDRPALARVRLIVTELVASSVRHARGDSIALTVWTGASLLRGRVTDGGSGFTVDPPAPARLGTGGWRLVLVRRLANRWGTLPDGRGIWFEVDGGPTERRRAPSRETGS